MKNAFKRFKNIIGMDVQSESKIVEEEKFELKENVDKVEEIAQRKFILEPLETETQTVCDVCKEHNVTLKTLNIVKVYGDGTREAKLDAPRVTHIGGDNKNGVIMCDECLKQCDNEDKTNFIWAAGMINILEENVEKIESKRQELYVNMETIKNEAEAKIQECLNTDAEFISELNEIKINIEQLIQHQQILGNKIESEMKAMAQENNEGNNVSVHN